LQRLPLGDCPFFYLRKIHKLPRQTSFVIASIDKVLHYREG
jgi:hypothetical protein